jgi:WD40 repeat protein
LSPFYAEHHFRYTTSFEIKIRPESGPVQGICINPLDNDEIAIAGGLVQVFQLRDSLPINRTLEIPEVEFPVIKTRALRRSSSANLRRSDFYSFDSPFTDFLPRDLAHAVAGTQLQTKRKFFPRWGPPRLTYRDIRTTCIAAHPTRPYFVTGSDLGRLHLWAFGQSSPFPESAQQYVEAPIREVVFNQAGDRLLMTTTDGSIFASDAITSHLMMSLVGSAAAWLNSDLQVIVAEPREGRIVVYDLMSGSAPVATYYGKNYTKEATLAVYGTQAVTGYLDGSVVILDIVSGMRQTLKLHKSPVTALHYDQSGRFFMSGAMENKIKIVNAKLDAEIEESGNLFTDYDSLAPHRGILSFATSKHTVAACGYSENIRIWHTSDPQSRFH